MRTDPEMTKIFEQFPLRPGVLYRGANLSSNDYAQLKPGKTYTLDKHSSATPVRQIARNFMEDRSNRATLFVIDQDSARKIPRMYKGTAGDEEREAVLMKGTKYKITDVSSKTTHRDLGHGWDHLGRMRVVRMKEI
jgi:hypothetical protein